ncbi:hypothetical protein ACI79J_16105 [Geodermatophilus sp. SYSU D01062]
MRALRRPAAVLSGAALALLATSGCSLLAAVAAPDEEQPVAVSSPEPAPSVPPPPAPVEVAAAELADSSGPLDFTGSVRVTRSAVAVGLPPLSPPFPQDCALPDDGSVRTLAVEVGFGNDTFAEAGLAATVELTAADGGAPRAGTAVFVASSSPSARWCQDGDTAPTRDGFGLAAGAGYGAAATVHVVARDAAPTSDLVLRISGLRNEAGSNATGPWDEVTVTAGACADDPVALCVPLG